MNPETRNAAQRSHDGTLVSEFDIGLSFCHGVLSPISSTCSFNNELGVYLLPHHN
jgi:hypothetical protein